jgi:hypothetical protein
MTLRRLADLASGGAFLARHVGPSRSDEAAMCAALGVESPSELLERALPPGIRTSRPYRLPDPVDEASALAELGRLAQAVERAPDLAALEALREPVLGMRQERRQGRDQGPLRFRTAGGHEVLVGRSAKENDALTRAARPSDLWFHTKDRQGAHCILRPLPGRAVGAPDRLEAALLAAYYSKQRRSSQVPVDYTFVRHVRRPRGAAPGFVLYDHHETLFVTPDRDAIEAIRRRRGSSRS